MQSPDDRFNKIGYVKRRTEDSPMRCVTTTQQRLDTPSAFLLKERSGAKF